MKNSAPEIFGSPAMPQTRSWMRAMFRGARKRCPQCANTKIFDGYTKTHDTCSSCGLDFTGHQADDAPPYFTIIILGHVLIPLALAVKQIFEPPLWLQFAIWGPALLIATFWLLPVCKGALIGLQWSNRMHGFGTDAKSELGPQSTLGSKSALEPKI